MDFLVKHRHTEYNTCELTVNVSVVAAVVHLLLDGYQIGVCFGNKITSADAFTDRLYLQVEIMQLPSISHGIISTSLI